MKVSEIAKAVESKAPRGLALDWDNTGLLVGDGGANVDKVLLTIDVTRAVVEEAKAKDAGLILSYHPVIWDGLKDVRCEGTGAVVYELIRAGISVYSIHTAYDIADGGVNDQLAEIVGIVNGAAIGDYVLPPCGELFKVVTFVPAGDVEKVAEAMFAAGAGSIGKYCRCSFRGEGTGTFMPLEGARPAIGKKDRFERVAEIKLESMVSGRDVGNVIRALKKSHPYETPAYDVLKHYEMEKLWGLGRMGDLEQPVDVKDIIERVKKGTGAGYIGIVGPGKGKVRKAAVCAGSCGKIINEVIRAGCGLYLTGELKHHTALAAAEAGLTCLCLSHTVSERFALKKIAKELKKTLGGVTIEISKKDKDPFEWIRI